MRSLVKRQRHCTGFAFVTFNDEATTLRCMELVNTRRPVFDGVKIKAERPPEPEEVC